MSELPSAPGPSELTPLAPVSSRNRLVLVLAIVLVVAAIGAGVALSTRGDDNQTGAATSADLTAGCDAVITKPTDRNQQHVNAPTAITYPDSPPAFGEHRPDFPPFGRAFYTADRPPVGNLVHTLEHGYTIAWYDDAFAQDDAAMAELQKIAEGYAADFERFIAAPWHGSDGGPFPTDRHLALVRWSADADDPSNQAEQRGNWMYCGGVDKAAITTFFDTWPNEESPEPGIQ